jgi:hypothetical protein
MMTTEEEDDSEFDHGDEIEESVGDSAHDLGRQSISEMVTRHKLHTSTPISDKVKPKFDRPIEIGQRLKDHSSDDSFDEGSANEDSLILIERPIINECGAFEW